MNEALSPCPFCGQAATQKMTSQGCNHGQDPLDTLHVGCASCGVWLSCSNYPGYITAVQKNELAARWNKRVAGAPQPAGEYPALPDAAGVVVEHVPVGGGWVRHERRQSYTADQMRAYADATCAMRAAQPAGAQQPDTAYAELPSYEHQRAIMEAERNASLDEYSRIVLLTSTESRIYERAFTNGWNRRASHGQAPAQAAPQQEAQEPCPTCAALARTVMLDQVSFDRKPDCYGIRQITDDEGVEEWEDIRTSPDVAREEANDMMATGRGEIYEVVPLWTTPQPTQAQAGAMPRPVTAAEHEVLMAAARDNMTLVAKGRLVESPEEQAAGSVTAPAAGAVAGPTSDLHPEKCPITGRPFFMTLAHPELGRVPTYGGPYDSYTIPAPEGEPTDPWHERELRSERYDHDAGWWVEGGEPIPLRIVHEDVLFELQEDAEAAATPTPPTQAADSVLEDAARLDWLLLHISGAEFRRIGVHYSGNARRADVDAARKQGANHD